MMVLVRLARDRQVMGGQPVSGMLAAAGWAATFVAGGAGAAFIAVLVPG